MISLFAGMFLGSLALAQDTVIQLGMTHRDMTGDGRPETLRLTGTGRSTDSLDVMFTIEADGQVIFRMALTPLTRTVGFDGTRRRITASEQQKRLADFDDFFFGERKFTSPAGFIEELRSQGPGHIAEIPNAIARNTRRQFVADSLVAAGLSRSAAETRTYAVTGSAADVAAAAERWAEIQRSGVTVFSFSPGGDAIWAIAWSERDRRFHRLMECC
jgi:hypothetical protein